MREVAQTGTWKKKEKKKKHKQGFSLEVRLAEARTGADGLFGGAVAASSEEFNCLLAEHGCVCVCVWQREQRFTYNCVNFTMSR